MGDAILECGSRYRFGFADNGKLRKRMTGAFALLTNPKRCKPPHSK